MEPLETENAQEKVVENSQPAGFQQKKRIWTIVFVCAFLLLIVAACIRATDDPGAPKSESVGTTLNTEQVSKEATPTAIVAVEPTAASQTSVTTTDTQTNTVEPVASAPISETASVTTTTGTITTSQQPEVAAPSADPSTATVTDEYNGIPVGFTSEGYPFRGSPDAPVTMYEYSDFQCPFCSRYFVQTEPAINESYVRTGQVRVIFRDFPLEGLHPNAPAAHEAANCVAEQGAKLYWGMHDQLFRSQQEWSQSPDPLPVFKRLVEEIDADVALYETCLAGGTKKAAVVQGVVEANDLGYQGTPSFRFVNTASGEGYDLIGAQPYEQFSGYIEAIAAGQAPASAQSQSGDNTGSADSGGGDSGGGGGIPTWASADGLKPDPARSGLTTSGDHYRGDPNAPVVVIEFSDFQCPYCKRHYDSTESAIKEQFIATKQVMWVFKHFPLSIHPQAIAAGVASECAADQNKFWEMHDQLFVDPSEWSISEPTSVFSGYAQQLGLDVTSFDTCQQAPDVQERVLNDMNDGSQFVRGTPSFIILKGGQGRIIPGALPKDEFISALQEIVEIGFTQ